MTESISMGLITLEIDSTSIYKAPLFSPVKSNFKIMTIKKFGYSSGVEFQV